jgi:hypothetical protein
MINPNKNIQTVAAPIDIESAHLIPTNNYTR